ncbi:MAG: NUDIX domain-containing protein [Lachnospiraceae bacterium]|nr:NUDIX domain-containing protein [Lachnospiraceae bacterium]
MTLTTLCYIENEDSYLMLHRIKKKNDINQDKWIGIGGHFESGESPEECLQREAMEETGLTLTSCRFRGIVTFICDSLTDYYMCLYTADSYTGTLKECEEGTLEWVKKDRIPELNLWEGDLIFFQLLEEDVPFFSLKLRYEKDVLREAVLDGQPLELLDIVDQEGNPTGKVRERSLVHRYGSRHRTAHVWIVRPGAAGSFDLLLQERAGDKDSFPGCLDISSAGHIPAGKGYQESALRELEEELGITVSPQELVFVGFHEGVSHSCFHGKPFHNQEYSAVYLLERDIEISQLNFQKEEIASLLWMDYAACMEGLKNGTLNHCLFPEELEMLGAKYKEML